MRELKTLRTISNLTPIPNADRIETAHIDGWTVIVKKGEFKIGDKCIFFEVDSWLPDIEPFSFLKTTTWRGMPGHRIKTMKMKGQLSQGLALPVTDAVWGTDVKLWEEDVPVQLTGQIKGTFPPFLVKTDQERIQNIYDTIDKDADYEVTVKVDGTSLTVYNYNGIGVCSRNLELKLDDTDNLYVKYAQELFGVPDGYAVQAEIAGPGINGNRAGLSEIGVYIFDVYDIQEQRYITPAERLSMRFHTLVGVKHCPILKLGKWPLSTLDVALASADGTGLTDAPREGIVLKRFDGMASFKIISNEYLLKWGL